MDKTGSTRRVQVRITLEVLGRTPRAGTPTVGRTGKGRPKEENTDGDGQGDGGGCL